jgi:hypothetical protein
MEMDEPNLMHVSFARQVNASSGRSSPFQKVEAGFVAPRRNMPLTGFLTFCLNGVL